MSSKKLGGIAIVVGVIFLALAFFYWLTPANALPSYFPGYNPGLTTVHFKHGLAAFFLSLALFVFAWFQYGKKPGSSAQ